MSEKLVECVPNFSEGRDASVIDAIAAAIAGVPGIALLLAEAGADANRTVMTFTGAPDAVAEAAFRGISVAADRIDMRNQRGIHPRIGAADVCPFVPLRGATIADCVAISRAVGKRIGEELGIPVFLYEHSATHPERRLLANIRAGQYENLAQKLADPQWQPDFGPVMFNPKSGATVIGARDLLIAFNINLDTPDRTVAAKIAAELRESGALIRDPVSGERVRKPGIFKHLRALGWYVAAYGKSQITMNFTNFRETPPHIVFEKARELAAARGATVTGCEVIGMVPDEWIVAAGKFYRERQGQSVDAATETLIETAVAAMNLSEVALFDPQRKILWL